MLIFPQISMDIVKGIGPCADICTVDKYWYRKKVTSRFPTGEQNVSRQVNEQGSLLYIRLYKFLTKKSKQRSDL